MLSQKSQKITIFCVEIVCMVLEICASYLFSPYFGNSQTVWTGIIGVILLSNSIGNYIGGKLAEKKERNFVPFVLVATSVFVFLLGLANEYVCYFLSSFIVNNTLASLLASFILLLPSELCLGTIPPQVMARTASKGEKDISFVYMCSTIGGLVGTFVGGYFLIPRIGVNAIVLICGLLVLLLGIDFKKERLATKVVPAAIALAGIYAFSVFSFSQASTVYVDAMVFDSEYNRIVIAEGIDSKTGEEIRSMQMAQGFESATFLKETLRNDLMFPYLKAFDTVVEDGDEMLMIGGAAYQFPKHILAHYKDAKIDVVEIDSKVTELAKEYFFLQDTIDEFDPRKERIGLYNEDAKVYIKHCDKKYDIVFNDAFSGKEPVRTLTTLETVKEVESILKEDGMYVLNIAGNSDGTNCDFLKAECNTISKVLPWIYIQKCVEEDGPINYMVVASKVPLQIESIEMDYSQGIVLTDNYCPVDSLVHKK